MILRRLLIIFVISYVVFSVADIPRQPFSSHFSVADKCHYPCNDSDSICLRSSITPTDSTTTHTTHTQSGQHSNQRTPPNQSKDNTGGDSSNSILDKHHAKAAQPKSAGDKTSKTNVLHTSMHSSRHSSSLSDIPSSASTLVSSNTVQRHCCILVHILLRRTSHLTCVILLTAVIYCISQPHFFLYHSIGLT